MKKDYSSLAALSISLWENNQIDQLKSSLIDLGSCLTDHHGRGDIYTYFLLALYAPSFARTSIDAKFPLHDVINHFSNEHLAWLDNLDVVNYVATARPKILSDMLIYGFNEDAFNVDTAGENFDIQLSYFPTQTAEFLRDAIISYNSSTNNQWLNRVDNIITACIKNNIFLSQPPEIFAQLRDLGFDESGVISLESACFSLVKKTKPTV